MGLLLSLTGIVEARQDTLYMSVLNSRKHRLAALDNPIVGLFVSTDAGATWQHQGWRGYTRTFYTEVGPDGTIWSACGNGVLRSTDHGVSWRVTTGWQITEVLKVKVHPRRPAEVYAASAYGVFKTEDGGETWKAMNKGFLKPFVSDIVIDSQTPTRLLAASEDGVYQSVDAGAQWRLVGIQGKGVRTIVQHPTIRDMYLAGTEEDGVFVSTDRGEHWKPSNTGLLHRTVYAIACDRQNPNTVYVGTHGGGVYRSTDGGKHWSQTVNGLETLVVHSLVLLPSNPSVLFAGTLNGGLFKSTDGGDHWIFNSQEEAQVWGLWAR